ncbi:hypothetical protein MPSEU_000460200 [Mayamaea pseudoterrestris]|nr:hypothetical protein MPSEU_000460200 [Mayamaea pseudoterrestris]
MAYPLLATRISASTAVSLLWRHAQQIDLKVMHEEDAANDSFLSSSSTRMLANLDRISQIAAVFKLVSPIPYDDDNLEQLRDFFLRAVTSCQLQVEHLRVVVVAYGRACEWNRDNLQKVLSADFLSTLTSMQQVCLLQGVLAAVSSELLLTECHDQDTFLQVFLAAFKRPAMDSPDPHVRLAALKGIQTLLSHMDHDDDAQDNQLLQSLTNETLHIVLHAWENPDRRLAHSLPCLFQTIVRIMRKQLEPTQLQTLVHQILKQPPHRKGRYLALETLLPETGAQFLLDAAGPQLITEFLLGIADFGHNTVAIADLWAKLLQTLLHEQLLAAGMQTARKPMNRKERRKLNVEPERGDSSAKASLIRNAWLGLWVPSLAHALVTMEANRRSQIASFCLARIWTIVDENRAMAAKVLQCLLLQIDSLRLDGRIKLPLVERDTISDRILWASLETVMIVGNLGLLSQASGNDGAMNSLRETITSCVSLDSLSLGLVHASIMVRSSAFCALSTVIACHKPSDNPLSRILLEAKFWEESLAFAAKDVDRQYLSSLCLCLLNFMDRLSAIEAEGFSNGAFQPRLSQFVNDFLINDILCKKTGYPGSPSSKATFALAILECILDFSSRKLSSDKSNRNLCKSGTWFNRARSLSEEVTLFMITTHVLSANVFCMIVSLLSSAWDDTRLKASELLERLVHMAIPQSIELPRSVLDLVMIENHAVYLASSPRQHECDTGARLLQLVCLLCPSDSAKITVLERLFSLVRERLKLMAQAFDTILTDERWLSENGLPLAHGLIRGMRLVLVELNLSFYANPEVFTAEIADLLREALRLSLSVIGDTEDSKFGNVARTQNAIVNPGALGANGITGSLKRVTLAERSNQMASQRLVVGSCLLIKDACEAFVYCLCSTTARAAVSSVDDAGILLLETQVSVKHTGAAYAAHKALQQLAVSCLASDDEELKKLPRKWMINLLHEISDTSKSRNSTLRRSTGYALGFLSLMRSEVSSRHNSVPLCETVLNRLLSMSLPSPTKMTQLLDCLHLPHDVIDMQTEGDSLTTQGGILRRIHSLNIVRMILLDSPLSSVSVPIAGKALVSSVLGYMDPDWATRNSATMVFSAAMLRAVDPDKNAASVDNTSSRAANIADLYKAYPMLSDFFRSVFIHSHDVSLARNNWSSMPPVFPLMVFLSRVQPTRMSGTDATIQTENLIYPLLESTRHKHITMRKGAARALANLSCGEQASVASPLALLQWCRTVLISPNVCFNQIHGTFCLIFELLQTQHELRESFGTYLMLDLIIEKGLRIVGGRPCAPALVMSSAFRILQITNAGNEYQHYGIATIEWLEKECSNDIGAAELGSIVGAGICANLLSLFWTIDTVDRILEARLLTLLSSPSFDVRVAAIKTLKKSIYEGVDGWLAADTEYNERFDVLQSILFTTLAGELDARSHNPNVRRLSRCLIECLNARVRHDNAAFSESNEPSELWQLALRMIGVSAGMGDEQGQQDFTAIDGNAAELMSFVIRWKAQPAEALNVFKNLVSRLSDPYKPWRLRHSAAVALSGSKLLNETAAFSETTLSVRRAFTIPAMMLLQDNDADVRQAAALSLLNKPALQLMKLEPTSDYILRSELDVCTSFESVLAITLAYTDTLEPAMTEFIDEFKIVGTTSPGSLLNSNSDRKIFEEEVPNDYIEMALPIQLMLRKLLAENFAVTQEEQELAQRLLRRCLSILKLLGCRHAASEIFDVSSDRRVMPQLHSLLLVSGAVMFCFDEKRSELQTLAEEACRLPLHPLVYDALEMLRDAAVDEPSRCQKILGCCFLTSEKCLPA